HHHGGHHADPAEFVLPIQHPRLLPRLYAGARAAKESEKLFENSLDRHRRVLEDRGTFISEADRARNAGQGFGRRGDEAAQRLRFTMATDSVLDVRSPTTGTADPAVTDSIPLPSMTGGEGTVALDHPLAAGNVSFPSISA